MHFVPRSLRGLKPQRVLLTTRRISSASQLSAQGAPSDPHGTTGQICNWVKSVGLKEIPEEIRTRTKYLILDGIGCALVGAKLPWSRTAKSALFQMDGPDKCTLFGWDRSVTPLDAVLLNSIFIQGFELDDVHADAPWHANSIILPSLFAAIEHGGEKGSSRPVVNGESFLLSTIVGFEIGSRVGHALHFPEMLTRGWRRGAVLGPPAAVVAVSKLLDLPPEQTENAIGLAHTQSYVLMSAQYGSMSAQYGSMSKRMQHGFAAHNGLFCALMAKECYAGIDKVPERPYGGYLSTFPTFLIDKLTDGLGESWAALEGIKVKPYASMIATHCPIDCIAVLQERHPESFNDPAAIRKITIEQSKAPYAHGGQEVQRPLNAVGALMSTRYTAAAQILDRVVLMDQFNAANLDRDNLWDIVDKIDCVWNPEFDDKSAWYTRVTVDFESRPSLVEEAVQPSTYGRPLSNEAIRKKWVMLADTVMDADRRDAIESLILDLDSVDDVSDIVQLLSLEVSDPIGTCAA